MERLVVVGQGYGGRPVALRACERGFVLDPRRFLTGDQVEHL